MRGKAWKVTDVRTIIRMMNSRIRAGMKIRPAADDVAAEFPSRTGHSIECIYHRFSKRRPRKVSASRECRSELFLAVPKNGGTSGEVKYFGSSKDAAKALLAELELYTFYRGREVKLELDVKES
jgi:hypothetical protein